IRELIAELRDAGTTVFMSTHILSDVEALCDEVAVLRRGKLGATGTLDELLLAAPADQAFEITLRGVDSSFSTDLGNSTVRGTSVVIRVEHESQIDAVLAEARKHGGSVISILAVKQSLEDLFVEPA